MNDLSVVPSTVDELFTLLHCEEDICEPAKEWVKTAGIKTLKQAWKTCTIPDWMLWALNECGKRDVWADREFSLACALQIPEENLDEVSIGALKAVCQYKDGHFTAADFYANYRKVTRVDVGISAKAALVSKAIRHLMNAYMATDATFYRFENLHYRGYQAASECTDSAATVSRLLYSNISVEEANQFQCHLLRECYPHIYPD